MLDSEPAAVSFLDAFRYAVADSAYRDPDVWEHYSTGFSPPVVARAIRTARLQGVLSPGRFVKLCIGQRRQFRIWNADLDTLMHLRWDAEDVLEKLQPRLALTHADEMDIPF